MARKNKKKKEKIGEMRIPADELQKEYEALEPDSTLTEIIPTKEDLEEMKNINYMETSAEVVGYASKLEQLKKYNFITNVIPEKNSILDFGCGRGDYYGWHEKTFGAGNLDYLGVDANKVLIDSGKRLYEGIQIINNDWSNLPDDTTRDWCINIDSNNLRYDLNVNKSSHDYLLETIDIMYKHANKGILLTLSSTMNKEESPFEKYNPSMIFDIVQTKYKGAALDHSSSDNEFTLIIYKNEE